MCLASDKNLTNELKNQPAKWTRVYKILGYNKYGKLCSPFYMNFIWRGPGKYKPDNIVIDSDFSTDKNIQYVENAIHVYSNKILANNTRDLCPNLWIVVPMFVSTKDIVGANKDELAVSKIYFSPWQFCKANRL